MIESYCITPPFLCALSPADFKTTLFKSFSTHHPVRACLRAPHAHPDQLTCFVELCKTFEISSYLNLSSFSVSLNQALEYGFFGVHAKGDALQELSSIPPTLSSFYSAHSTLEVQQALELGASFCTLSPIFSTPNKPPPLGLEYLDQLTLLEKDHVFGLGGIVEIEQVKLIASKGLRGFASVRYFL
ncbi:thiamine phosphate synthase [Helicobacter cynogastricus]|uniref:thiamine phosphate synthase n=1 Tax=Helicobacter cynogastricus TaxID=329937 RepID=UPI00131575D6|nr:thiamine phosphate synthase [Helicobacter cynogastricus]